MIGKKLVVANQCIAHSLNRRAFFFVIGFLDNIVPMLRNTSRHH